LKVVGVVLAGGQSRRMGGGDKALRLLGGVSMLERVVERLRPQVAEIVINANGDPVRFANFGIPVVPDSVPDFAGPLAGVLAGLDWTADHHPDCSFIASVATDAPFFPTDLITRLAAELAAADADLACATSGGRAHPVFGLWPLSLREDLRRAVLADGLRKVDQWTSRYKLIPVPFPDAPVDPFFNANRPEDLLLAETLLPKVAS
jgi:molybdopterin-guanine dinucleotide biosynthesis protein A